MRLLLLCALAFSHVASAQVRMDPLGLSGKRVYDLALWGAKIYAATDDGVYVRWSQQNPDTAWTQCGLAGMRVRAIYPHQSGPLGYALTAGIEHRPGEEDSVVVYCSENSDSAWVPADEGIDRSQVRMVRSIDGFPSPEICGETYAATEGLVFRRQIGGPWETVFAMGIVTTNVVRANMANASVWVGGETTILAPFISRSDDKGETWTTAYPNLQGDNACDALAFDPADTSLVYAGMEGTVIVSRDGGRSWESAGLRGTPFYFFGLEVNPTTRRLFAGGAAHGGLAGLFATTLGDTAWTTFATPPEMQGILTLLSLPSTGDEERLLLGTDGSGVFCFSISPCAVEDHARPPGICLLQNYPNPFNPATTIHYTLPGEATVLLQVCDLLGREIATLEAGRQKAGQHSAQWDATGLPSGVYLARLWAGTEHASIIMVLAR